MRGLYIMLFIAIAHSAFAASPQTITLTDPAYNLRTGVQMFAISFDGKKVAYIIGHRLSYTKNTCAVYSGYTLYVQNLDTLEIERSVFLMDWRRGMSNFHSHTPFGLSWKGDQVVFARLSGYKDIAFSYDLYALPQKSDELFVVDRLTTYSHSPKDVAIPKFRFSPSGKRLAIGGGSKVNDKIISRLIVREGNADYVLYDYHGKGGVGHIKWIDENRLNLRIGTICIDFDMKGNILKRYENTLDSGRLERPGKKGEFVLLSRGKNFGFTVVKPSFQWPVEIKKYERKDLILIRKGNHINLTSSIKPWYPGDSQHQ